MIDYVLFWHYASIFVASNEQVEFDIANKNIKKKKWVKVQIMVLKCFKLQKIAGFS